MSVTRPARANVPSNRSWLSIAFSGTRPASAALESVDVVDALARVTSLAEQVLVDVRNGRGVGIDPGRAGEDPLEQRRCPLGGERRGDPRLEDPVAMGNTPGLRVDARAVERVGDRPDEALDRAAGNLVSASRVTT